jgi:hypothetical protein
VKKYLNRDEKNATLAYGAFLDFLASQIAKWTQAKYPRGALANLKRARAFADKALQEVLEGLDTEEVRKIRAEIPRMEIVTTYRANALQEYRKLTQATEVTPVATDDLLSIAELTIEGYCKRCRNHGTLVEGCHVRKLFVKYDVEPLTYDPGEGCPYRYGQ